MEQTHPRSRYLLAVASLVGLDRAIPILESERSTGRITIERLRAMSLDDLARETRSPAKFVTYPTGSGKSDVIALERERAVREVGEITKDNRLRTHLKTAMQDGPVKIAVLVYGLKVHGLVPDESPETRRGIIRYLSMDKTFARGPSGGVYQLRHRSG